MAKRILVVDDEPEVVDILKFRLKSWGYEAFSASSGHEALKIAEEEKPDLLLLDIMMPGMSGFEALKELKARESTRDIPVIILTVASARHELEQGLKLGAAFYISKPYDAQELLNRIKEVLGSAA